MEGKLGGRTLFTLIVSSYRLFSQVLSRGRGRGAHGRGLRGETPTPYARALMGPYLRAPRTLWLALMLASLLYPVVVVFARANDPEPLAPEIFLLPAFHLAALLTTIAIAIVPRRMRARSFRAFGPRVETAGGEAEAWPGYRSKVRGARVLRLGDADRRAVARSYRAAHVAALALAEAIALMGFVLGFLGFPWPFWAPVSAFGTFLIALLYPTERAMLRPLERAHAARVVWVD
jgi:hypothetical protein